MSFTDHKIAQFEHRISDLADQPNMPQDELKARFDACPEQLRVSLNAVCDEAAALDNRVDGILTQTFEGTIDKSMLSPELVAEIDAKSVETSVASRIATETATRENADSALSTRVSSLESKMPQRVRIAYGTYDGDNTDGRTFTLGFKPYLVIISSLYLVQFELPNVSVKTRRSDPFHFAASHLTSNGFTVSKSDCISGAPDSNPNATQFSYQYIAFGL